MVGQPKMQLEFQRKKYKEAINPTAAKARARRAMVGAHHIIHNKDKAVAEERSHLRPHPPLPTLFSPRPAPNTLFEHRDDNDTTESVGKAVSLHCSAANNAFRASTKKYAMQLEFQRKNYDEAINPTAAKARARRAMVGANHVFHSKKKAPVEERPPHPPPPPTLLSPTPPGNYLFEHKDDNVATESVGKAVSLHCSAANNACRESTSKPALEQIELIFDAWCMNNFGKSNDCEGCKNRTDYTYVTATGLREDCTDPPGLTRKKAFEYCAHHLSSWQAKICPPIGIQNVGETGTQCNTVLGLLSELADRESTSKPAREQSELIFDADFGKSEGYEDNNHRTDYTYVTATGLREDCTDPPGLTRKKAFEYCAHHLSPGQVELCQPSGLQSIGETGTQSGRDLGLLSELEGNGNISKSVSSGLTNVEWTEANFLAGIDDYDGTDSQRNLFWRTLLEKIAIKLSTLKTYVRRSPDTPKNLVLSNKRSSKTPLTGNRNNDNVFVDEKSDDDRAKTTELDNMNLVEDDKRSERECEGGRRECAADMVISIESGDMITSSYIKLESGSSTNAANVADVSGIDSRLRSVGHGCVGNANVGSGDLITPSRNKLVSVSSSNAANVVEVSGPSMFNSVLWCVGNDKASTDSPNTLVSGFSSSANCTRRTITDSRNTSVSNLLSSTKGMTPTDGAAEFAENEFDMDKNDCNVGATELGANKRLNKRKYPKLHQNKTGSGDTVSPSCNTLVSVSSSNAVNVPSMFNSVFGCMANDEASADASRTLVSGFSKSTSSTRWTISDSCNTSVSSPLRPINGTRLTDGAAEFAENEFHMDKNDCNNGATELGASKLLNLRMRPELHPNKRVNPRDASAKKDEVAINSRNSFETNFTSVTFGNGTISVNTNSDIDSTEEIEIEASLSQDSSRSFDSTVCSAASSRLRKISGYAASARNPYHSDYASRLTDMTDASQLTCPPRLTHISRLATQRTDASSSTDTSRLANSTDASQQTVTTLPTDDKRVMNNFNPTFGGLSRQSSVPVAHQGFHSSSRMSHVNHANDASQLTNVTLLTDDMHASNNINRTRSSKRSFSPKFGSRSSTGVFLAGSRISHVNDPDDTSQLALATLLTDDKHAGNNANRTKSSKPPFSPKFGSRRSLGVS